MKSTSKIQRGKVSDAASECPRSADGPSSAAREWQCERSDSPASFCLAARCGRGAAHAPGQGSLHPNFLWPGAGRRYDSGVSKKSGKIAERIAAFQGGALNAYYLGYFDCFNRQEFYEAHDVLEELWLADRHGPNGDFYKGLIQLAGAFVHLQKERLRPSAALFKLARTNLTKYPAMHELLDLTVVLRLIETWLVWLEGRDFDHNPLRLQPPPVLGINATAG